MCLSLTVPGVGLYSVSGVSLCYVSFPHSAWGWSIFCFWGKSVLCVFPSRCLGLVYILFLGLVCVMCLSLTVPGVGLYSVSGVSL